MQRISRLHVRRNCVSCFFASVKTSFRFWAGVAVPAQSARVALAYGLCFLLVSMLSRVRRKRERERESRHERAIQLRLNRLIFCGTGGGYISSWKATHFLSPPRNRCSTFLTLNRTSALYGLAAQISMRFCFMLLFHPPVPLCPSSKSGFQQWKPDGPRKLRG